MREYFVYIVASHSGVLYIGFTGNLYGRILQHKQRKIAGFTQKYKCTKLVYYEGYEDVFTGIAREKQLKKWRREKKIKLIQRDNPHLQDLAKHWYKS